MSEKKFLVMGSAAAEGVPGYFCDCKLCRYAMEHGGKDVRMRTQYQLGDHVRIDFGPDNYAQELRYNIDSSQIKHLFITHSHIDHFVPDSLAYRRPGMSRVAEDNILNIYGGTDTMKKLNDFFWTQFDFHGNYDFWRLKPNWIHHGSEVEIAEEDMTFVALSADHMHENRLATPLIYMIRWGEKYILVANDTGYFTDETWQVIVNDERIEYGRLNLTGAIAQTDFDELGNTVNGDMNKRPFQNYVITTELHLKEGENVIRLVTNNKEDHGGTFNAETPLIDCLYIYSSAEASWAVCYPENVGQTMADVTYDVTYDTAAE